ncbi:MAG: hypothetical protein ABIY70_16170 [Capsulimonas sp.]|uniref:hypothetical protein n=1 Tax=Capsulimonas sp. TaxID=2494211 RepID=UPI003264CA9A
MQPAIAKSAMITDTTPLKLTSILPVVCLCPMLLAAGAIVHNYTSSNVRAAKIENDYPIVKQHGIYSKKLSQNFKSHSYVVTRFESFDYYTLTKHASLVNDGNEMHELEAAHRRHDISRLHARSQSSGADKQESGYIPSQP